MYVCNRGNGIILILVYIINSTMTDLSSFFYFPLSAFFIAYVLPPIVCARSLLCLCYIVYGRVKTQIVRPSKAHDLPTTNTTQVNKQWCQLKMRNTLSEIYEV